MALLRKINTKAKTENNTGFGTNTSDYGGRLVNKDGRANIEKRGINFLERISWYHTMLEMPRWKFFLIIFSFYIAVNFVFAGIYYFIGVEHLGGMVTTSQLEQFGEAYFFSAQTFTTVGYGRINPTGFVASAVAALEALLGLLSFALATGLLYGRFSKPTAYLKFSKHALIAPFKEGIALMMRVAPFKNTTLSDAEVKLTLGMSVEENGKMVNRFFPLELEFSKINLLTLSWTIVHPITESSPLYKLTPADFASLRGEVLVFFKAFDDMFSNTVVARTSYTFGEFITGAKFVPMYHSNTESNTTVLDFDKLDMYNEVDISQAFAAAADAAAASG
jgi:Inward rectifier potassium channel C-terminal domain/Inward rectifier potassium channel transmembrane domain